MTSNKQTNDSHIAAESQDSTNCISVKRSITRIFTVVVLIAMMLFPWITLAKPGAGASLTGAFVTTERPEMTRRGVINGEYMSTMGDYISENLPGREYLIKTKNELAYRGFHNTPAPRVVIGKDDVLFSKSTIELWYQLTGPTTEETIDELAGKLTQVRDIMARHGIDTMVYITPSKVRYYEEYVPDLYSKVASPLDPHEHAITRLKRRIEAENIPVFDSIEWIDARIAPDKTLDGIPLFTKNGMHWSVVNGAKVGAALGDFIHDTYGYDEPVLKVSAQPVDEPVTPDADLAGIMNMYSELEDTYYDAVITAEPRDSDAQPAILPNMLCRGGSFMGQSLSTLIFNGGFGTELYMENTQCFKNRFTDVRTFSDYGELNLKEELADKNLLILEVNEASVDVFSFQFMDYVIEHEDELFEEEGV